MATNLISPVSGKLALITGASGGIGKATAQSLAKLGCSIAVHYHAAEEVATSLVNELKALGVRAHAFQADLSEYEGARKLHADVVSQLGNPDILFNNAGTTLRIIKDLEEVSIEEVEVTWRTNLGTAFLLTQLCLPHMKAQKFGRIIFCSSVAAGTGGVIGPHYASSKSAMHGLVHWIASRYATEGITCNAVAPALITETTMFRNPSEDLRKKIPINRFGLPHEIASVIDLLVTNSYMTNKILVVDGGMTPSAF